VVVSPLRRRIMKKRRYITTMGVWSLALLALALFIPTTSASVIGHISVANCGGGGVIVDLTNIDWEPGDPAACVQLGINTNLTSVGLGTLTPGSPQGTINDLPPLGGIFGFMTFGSFVFDLDAVGGFGPGSATSCATNPALNSSCSIPGSPFLLTRTTTGTSVTLSAHGTIADTAGPISVWNGSFTTQINNVLPAAIQAKILAGGEISSSFSGEFDVTATAIPEPVSMALIGAGLAALASIKRRKRA